MSGHLRIIHLASTKRWSGIAEPMLNIAFHQKALGHEVWVGCTPGRSLERYIKSWGLRIIAGLRLNSRPYPFQVVKDIRCLRSLLDTIRPDVVHCHLLHDHWLAAIATYRRKDTPVIVHTMHRFAPPYKDPLHRWLFCKRTDGIILPSEAMHRLVETAYPQLGKRLFVIYGGVNQERFHPGVDALALRRELGIPADAPVAGVVSRLRKDRGFDWLFAAIPRVLEQVPDSRIVLVGEGELKHKLRSLVQKQPFAGRVIMAGYRSNDLPDAYAAMDVSVFLALGSEGSCRAVMEAMATGRPVIGVALGAVPEIIQDRITGFTVPSGDATLLAKRLCEMLSDRQRAHQMGKAARRRAEDMFALHPRAEQTIEVYETLLSNRHHSSVISH